MLIKIISFNAFKHQPDFKSIKKVNVYKTFPSNELVEDKVVTGAIFYGDCTEGEVIDVVYNKHASGATWFTRKKVTPSEK